MIEDSSNPENRNIESEYDELHATRAHYVDRARAAAKLTIPSEVQDNAESFSRVPVSNTNITEIEYPAQGFGARGVQHLAAQLTNGLFPPGRPFFRYDLSQEVWEDIEKEGLDRSEIEKILASEEIKVTETLEANGGRRQIASLMIHLIITGNGAIEIMEDNSIRFFPIYKYAGLRDLSDNLKKVITRDYVDYRTLPKEQRDKVDEDLKKSTKSSDNGVPFYQKWELNEDGSYQKTQYLNTTEISSVKQKTLSIILPRWFPVYGQFYGLGYIDSLMPDLSMFDSLSMSLKDAAMLSAKWNPRVRAGAHLDSDEFARLENGEVVTGEDGDYGVVQANKGADLGVPANVHAQLRSELGASFLLNTSLQREGERVTATEINFIARELEETLGGVYTHLASEFQKPLAERLILQLKKQGVMKVLPIESVKVTITTGLDALRRENELFNIQTFIQMIQQIPESELSKVNFEPLIKQMAIGTGVARYDVIKTQEQIAQEQQALLAQQGGQAFAESAGQSAGQNLTGENIG